MVNVLELQQTVMIKDLARQIAAIQTLAASLTPQTVNVRMTLTAQMEIYVLITPAI
jgi:hypothetical protein